MLRKTVFGQGRPKFEWWFARQTVRTGGDFVGQGGSMDVFAWTRVPSSRVMTSTWKSMRETRLPIFFTAARAKSPQHCSDE